MLPVYSSLLGVEPLSYYLMNGVLNFNIVFVLALLAPLAVEAQVEYYLKWHMTYE